MVGAGNEQNADNDTPTLIIMSRRWIRAECGVGSQQYQQRALATTAGNNHRESTTSESRA
jgi:hypothetical protein